MKKTILYLLFLHITFTSIAGQITGVIADDKGNPLPYASLSIKGTTRGTTTNSLGKYSIALNPGEYILVAQYIGYAKEERTIAVTGVDQVVNFSLSIQQLTLQEVVVKKGEDPAYEIIRNAIRKRDYYNGQVDSFSVKVYIKGLMRSGGMPKKLMEKRSSAIRMTDLTLSVKAFFFYPNPLPRSITANPGI